MLACILLIAGAFELLAVYLIDRFIQNGPNDRFYGLRILGGSILGTIGVMSLIFGVVLLVTGGK
jgi:hypothetical protein